MAAFLIPSGTYSVTMGLTEAIAAACGEKTPIPDPIVSFGGEVGKTLGSESSGRVAGHLVHITKDFPSSGPLNFLEDSLSLVETIDNTVDLYNDPVIKGEIRKEQQ